MREFSDRLEEVLDHKSGELRGLERKHNDNRVERGALGMVAVGSDVARLGARHYGQ